MILLANSEGPDQTEWKRWPHMPDSEIPEDTV